MMRAFVTVAAAMVALGGCKREPTAAERAAADAKAIAQVEAAQERFPPLKALDPQPITPGDLERAELLGAGCAFIAAEHREPVLVLRSKRAVMKLGRNLTSFASDPGSRSLPLGTWTHYVGKAGSLRVSGDGRGDPGPQNGVEWPASLTATDEHDRIVYTRAGRLRCGA